MQEGVVAINQQGHVTFGLEVLVMPSWLKCSLSCRCEVARKFHASSDHGQVGLSSRISIGADAGELRTGASGRGEDDFTETYRAIFLMCA